jgi:chromosome segregation ATPase
MARLGIGYEHVSKAALELARAGQAVTVDNVRLRLGGTGSKSTIAPLLKRWKTENIGGTDGHPSLPLDLARSVQRLYEEVEQRFKAELEASQLAATLRVDECRAENGRLRQQLAERDDAHRRLEEMLASTKDRLVVTDATLVAARTEIKERELSQGFLEQRIDERNAEITNLRNQVTQAQRQFDHFQAAAQLRWDEERKMNEVKLADALRASEQLRQELRHAEHASLTSRAQFEQLSLGHEQLTGEHTQLQTVCDDLRQENARHEEASRSSKLEAHQYAETLAALQRAHDVTLTKLSDTKVSLAVSVSKAAMLEANLAASEQRAAAALSEQLADLRRYADVEGELRHCQLEVQHLRKASR